MAKDSIRIPIERNPDKLIIKAENIINKHVADGENSVLNFLNMTDMQEKTILARNLETLARKSNRDKALAYEIRDLALGIAPGHQIGEPDSVLYYLRSARNILLGMHKGSEHLLGEYGFDVSSNTGGIKIVVPLKAMPMIDLAKRVLAKQLAEGSASPISLLNIAEFTDKTNIAAQQHELALNLSRTRELSTGERNRLLGIAKNQKLSNVDTIRYYVTQVRDVLRGVYISNQAELGSWGFDVHYGVNRKRGKYSISGTVKAANNEAIKGALISVEGMNITVKSNTAGKYFVPVLPAGIYNIEVSKVNYSNKMFADLTIVDDVPAKLDVLLDLLPGRIIVNVMSHGQPLAGAMVSIVELGMAFETGPNGQADFDNLPVGTYTITVSAAGKGQKSESFKVDPNTTSSFGLEMG